MLFAPVRSPRAQDASDDGSTSSPADAAEKSSHDFTVSVRAGAWIVFVEGEVEDSSGSGRFDTLDLTDDLGFDGATATFLGTGNLRLGRHDIWVTGFNYSRDEEESAESTLDFGDLRVAIDGSVVTDLDFVDVNFIYGYSFTTFEEHGVRLGPTIAVSYSSFDIELEEEATGEEEEIDEVFPTVTLGAQGAVPFGDFLLEMRAAGVYFNTDSFEAEGAALVWRPLDYLGLFAEFNAIYADISLNNEDVEVGFFGPVVGMELRF